MHPRTVCKSESWEDEGDFLSWKGTGGQLKEITKRNEVM